jgi:hypothetical protein
MAAAWFRLIVRPPARLPILLHIKHTTRCHTLQDCDSRRMRSDRSEDWTDPRSSATIPVRRARPCTGIACLVRYLVICTYSPPPAVPCISEEERLAGSQVEEATDRPYGTGPAGRGPHGLCGSTWRHGGTVHACSADLHIASTHSHACTPKPITSAARGHPRSPDHSNSGLRRSHLCAPGLGTDLPAPG